MYDIKKLVTVRNYALKVGQTVQNVYNLIKKGVVKSIKIDGVNFIEI